MLWTTPGFEALELSTQLLIGEALRRGHSVEVLDATANIIRIRGNGKTEYIQQATRTSADTYISPLLMENKQVTKRLLDGAGLRTPAGRVYTDRPTLSADYPHWRERSAVVKPNTTNFGIAVTLLPAPIPEEDFRAAGERAFVEDDTVLVEELLGGQEYRLLVIGDAVRAVLQRLPAHVVGDGSHTVAELIEIKNHDPRRGKGYHSPLEKIRQGAEEAERLAAQGLTWTSLPAAGRQVWLRRNSNISTGGDSLDFTDEIHPGYRDLAVAAAAAMGASICGVDMLIDGLTAEPTGHNYGIIELNFNPALHIHDFPFRGLNRQVERHVLDLLNL